MKAGVSLSPGVVQNCIFTMAHDAIVARRRKPASASAPFMGFHPVFWLPVSAAPLTKFSSLSEATILE
jgi:hypothetical protein